jgi:hypothetical protein
MVDAGATLTEFWVNRFATFALSVSVVLTQPKVLGQFWKKKRQR